MVDYNRLNCNVLVYSSKGGVGKTTIASQCIAGPSAATTTVIEIDAFNKDHQAYRKVFKKVVQLEPHEIKNVLKYIVGDNEGVVIDNGAAFIDSTLDVFHEYDIYEDIDLIVIPTNNDRKECKRALKMLANFTINGCKTLIVFNKRKPEKALKEQFSFFFKELPKYDQGEPLNFVELPYDELLEEDDPETNITLVSELARLPSLKEEAKIARRNGDMDMFDELMDKEIARRGALSFYEDSILPIYEKVVKLGTEGKYNEQ